jgi:hypothetical protein
MAAILRHGLETNPDAQDRLRFVAAQRTTWTLAWLSWHLAALSILWFFVSLARAHQSDTNSLLSYSVLLVAAAIVPDLIAESIEIGVLPELAEQRLQSTVEHPVQLVETIHRTAMILTGYLANGLYTLATFLATWATRRHYASWIVLAGLVISVFGFALSVSVLVNSVAGMFWSNVGLVPAIIVWQIGIAIDAARCRHRVSMG